MFGDSTTVLKRGTTWVLAVSPSRRTQKRVLGQSSHLIRAKWPEPKWLWTRTHTHGHIHAHQKGCLLRALALPPQHGMQPHRKPWGRRLGRGRARTPACDPHQATHLGDLQRAAGAIGRSACPYRRLRRSGNESNTTEPLRSTPTNNPIHNGMPRANTGRARASSQSAKGLVQHD